MTIPSEASSGEQQHSDGHEGEASASIDTNMSHAQAHGVLQAPQGLLQKLYEASCQKVASIIGKNLAVSSQEMQPEHGNTHDVKYQHQSQQFQPDTEAMQPDSEVQYLRDENFSLKKRLDECMAKSTSLQAVAASAKDGVKDAKEQQDSMKMAYQNSMRSLQECNDELQDQLRKLKANFDSYKVKKLRNQAIANSSKVPDDAIKSSWKQMAYNIRNIAATTPTASLTEKDILQHGHHYTDKSCAICEMPCEHLELLRDDELRASVIEGYIWRAVFRRIFEAGESYDGGKSWAGKPGMLFTALFRSLLGDAVKCADEIEFFQWKASSADMIDRLMGVDEDEMQQAIDEEYRGLLRFLPRDCVDRKAQRKQLHREIEKAFKGAVELHRVFMKSKANFYIDWAGVSSSSEDVTRYQPDMHDAEAWEKDLDATSIIRFVISPSLVKVGNADGGSYDKLNRLAKATVICD
ncbi:hypothetical protein Landi51_05487 [Colletotrichum acutatum]